MSRLKDSLSVIIIVNAAALYLIYFIIKNAKEISSLALSLISSLASALSPLFIGLVLAYIISPLSDFIDNNISAKLSFINTEDPLKNYRIKKRRYFVSILLSYLFVILSLVALIYAFAALIGGSMDTGSLGESIGRIRAYFMTLSISIQNVISDLPAAGLRTAAQNLYNYIESYLSQDISGSTIIHSIKNIGTSTIDFLLGIVVSIYLLKDKEYFLRLARKTLHIMLSQKTNAIVTETLHDIGRVLSLFLRGAILDATIVALLSSAALSIYGLEFSVFIGCFAGLLNVIPYFGPVIGIIPAFLSGFFSRGISYGAGAALILFLVQQLDCNIIYPKIVGDSTGLHPLFVLLSVSITGYYFGIAGMLAAVPVAGIVKVLILKLLPS